MDTFRINFIFLDQSRPNESVDAGWLPRVGEWVHFGGPDGADYVVRSVTYVVVEGVMDEATLRLDSLLQTDLG